MAASWNFEKRRDTCTRFLVGVRAIAEGKADRDTSLEKVRSRMRLSPEEALFAARKLHEEKLVVFEPQGGLRSSALGIERAGTLMAAVRARAARFEDVARLLREGGTPADVLAAVVRESGGSIPCGAPGSDPEAVYRIALVDDALSVERQGVDGSFEPPPGKARTE